VCCADGPGKTGCSTVGREVLLGAEEAARLYGVCTYGGMLHVQYQYQGRPIIVETQVQMSEKKGLPVCLFRAGRLPLLEFPYGVPSTRVPVTGEKLEGVEAKGELQISVYDSALLPLSEGSIKTRCE